MPKLFASIAALTLAAPVLAQPTYQAQATSELGTPDTNTTTFPPTIASPLEAEHSFEVPAQPGVNFYYSLDANVYADNPLTWSGRIIASLNAQNDEDPSTSGSISYQVSNQSFTVTRLDQPAAPGETIDIFLLMLYRFDRNGSNTSDSRTWATASFEYDLTFNGFNLAESDIGFSSFSGANVFFSGFSPAFVGPITVPLGEPIPFNLDITTTARTALFTCIACDEFQSASNISDIIWTPSQFPFITQNPGTYSFDAPSLGINNSEWTTEPPCPADVNADGVLDNGDIGAFVAAFLAADLAADFNNDGILDNGDIGAFVAAFLAGC